MLASDLDEARNSLGREKHLRAKAFIAITVTIRVEFDVAESHPLPGRWVTSRSCPA